jgi:hypothetical protein
MPLFGQEMTLLKECMLGMPLGFLWALLALALIEMAAKAGAGQMQMYSPSRLQHATDGLWCLF